VLYYLSTSNGVMGIFAAAEAKVLPATARDVARGHLVIST